MSKRNLATVLWFLMGWTAGSVLAVMVGLPSMIGLALGVPFAAAVRWGPVSRLWSDAPKDARHVRLGTRYVRHAHVPTPPPSPANIEPA